MKARFTEASLLLLPLQPFLITNVSEVAIYKRYLNRMHKGDDYGRIMSEASLYLSSSYSFLE